MNNHKFLQPQTVLQLCLALVFLLLPATTSAFFNDTETSPEQLFQASELQLLVSPTAQTLTIGAALPSPHTAVTIASSEHSLSANYDIETTSTEGDSDFCLSLDTSFATDGSAVGGPAASYSSGVLTTFADWDVSFTTANPATLTHGQSCTFTFLVTAWQSNMTKVTAGYRDTTNFSITVTASQVVLNEVLAKPDIGAREFIELYNNSDFDVNVAGWEIREVTGAGATTSHQVVSSSTEASDMVAYDESGSTVVPAHGFLALQFTGGSPYLNNDGDNIVLSDGANILDEYSFGEAIIGKSDARIPDGIGAWIDPIPTPGEPNIRAEAETPSEPESIDSVTEGSATSSTLALSILLASSSTSAEESESTGGSSTSETETESAVGTEDVSGGAGTEDTVDTVVEETAGTASSSEEDELAAPTESGEETKLENETVSEEVEEKVEPEPIVEPDAVIEAEPEPATKPEPVIDDETEIE